MSAVEIRSDLGFSDRVLQLLERVDYRRADTPQEREAIYRLRHDAYVREGAIRPNSEGRFYDAYDNWPNCYTFGLYVDGFLASSFRMHVATADHPDVPAAHVFPDLLKNDLAARRTIIDPTRFVADATCARRYPELPYATVRLGYLAAEYFRADYVLATVRSEHQAFYRRIFGHKVACPPRPYPTLDKPISLMNLHYPPARLQILARYPFFRSTVFERRMLFERAAALSQTAGAAA